MKFYRPYTMTACLTMLLAVVAFAVSPAAQTDEHGRFVNGVGEPWIFESKRYTKEFASTAQARWREIGADNLQMPDEWAGDYRLNRRFQRVAHHLPALVAARGLCHRVDIHLRAEGDKR